jgi:hypothetical protein
MITPHYQPIRFATGSPGKLTISATYHQARRLSSPCAIGRGAENAEYLLTRDRRDRIIARNEKDRALLE